MRYHKKGFSLIELLVVFAIVATVIAVATPAFLRTIQESHVRNQAESIAAGLQKTRNEAIRRNTKVTLWLMLGGSDGSLGSSCNATTHDDVGLGLGWVVSLDSPEHNCDAPVSETVSPRIIEKQPANGTAGVSVSSVSYPDGSSSEVTFFSFNGFGALTSDLSGHNKAMILVKNDPHYSHTSAALAEYAVIIEKAGKVRVCKYRSDVSDATDPNYCRIS